MKEEEMEIYDGEKWVELNVQNLTKICDVHGLIELIKQTTKKEHQMKDKDNIRDYVLWTLTAFVICSFVCIFLLNTKISEQKGRIEKIEQLLGEKK